MDAILAKEMISTATFDSLNSALLTDFTPDSYQIRHRAWSANHVLTLFEEAYQ